MSDPDQKKKLLPVRFEAEDEEREVTQNLLIPETLMEILCISLKTLSLSHGELDCVNLMGDKKKTEF